MKHLLLIFFLTSCFNFVQAKPKQDTTAKSSVQTPSITNIVNIPSSLQINDITEKETQNPVEKNMPWIVALLIGILSVLMNFWVSHRLRQSNETNLKNQTESNERNLQRQIESNERSLNKQIEASKETKLIEFKATIAISNRQQWLNELRQTLTDYLSSTSLIMRLPDNSEQHFFDERRDLVHKMSASKAKLELLLNNDKPEQKNLLDRIEELLSDVLKKINNNVPDVDLRGARSNTIEAARKLLGIHWDKIKGLK